MDIRDAQIERMAEAGQALALHWGHEPWSDSWARTVATTLLEAAIKTPYPVAAAASSRTGHGEES